MSLTRLDLATKLHWLARQSQETSFNPVLPSHHWDYKCKSLSLNIFLKIYLFISFYMHVGAYMCTTCTQVLVEDRENIRYHGAGVVCNCEPPTWLFRNEPGSYKKTASALDCQALRFLNVSAEYQIQVLIFGCKHFILYILHYQWETFYSFIFLKKFRETF